MLNSENSTWFGNATQWLQRRFRHVWSVCFFAALGLLALLWFLVRVIPKPSRAAYPCQRAAFPLASSFVVWLMALGISTAAWRKAHTREVRLWKACLWMVLAVLGGSAVLITVPELRIAASPNPAHGPLGTPKGIFPGRVAWVHAPDATKWDGFKSPEHWWQPAHTDLAVVEEMMSKAVRAVAGGNSDREAWAALFAYYNRSRGKGARDYQAGEKIAIKINLTTCNGRSWDSTVDILGTYEKQPSIMNTIDNSPQMLLVLLRHLVYVVGVRQSDISLGDPTANVPQFMWSFLHSEFPDVHFFEFYGGPGRVRTEFSKTPFHWSTPEANGKVPDYVPIPFAEADYLINFALLKGHSAGVTLCGKNLYGALLRCPDGYLRDFTGTNGMHDYLNLHASTPDPSLPGTPGLGHYRAIVDLLGHPDLGGKTLLYLVDGLFGGYFWDSVPRKWNMPPFNGAWPSSLFASLDPVAIDSVCYDFLLNEWPNVVNNGTESPGTRLRGGAEDYLHEAALANNPPSGTVYDPGQTGAPLGSLGVHEHWNNPVDKQYSRNLGTAQGIELVAIKAARPELTVRIERAATQVVLSWSASLTNLQLQSASTLSATNTWATENVTPLFVRGRNTAIKQATGSPNFFRLKAAD